MEQSDFPTLYKMDTAFRSRCENVRLPWYSAYLVMNTYQLSATQRK
jgi:hypothetical protein